MGLSVSGGTPSSCTICNQEMFVPIFGLKQKLALPVHEPWFQDQSASLPEAWV